MLVQTVTSATAEVTHIRKADYLVEGIPFKMASSLVREYHYAQGSANTAIYRHGLFHKEDPMVCLGAAMWMTPTRRAAESVSEDWKRVLTLSRLVVVPDMPTNSASFFLARSIAIIRRDGRFDTLVTYADEGRGHTGAIYRATNWTYVGINAGDPVFIHPETGRQFGRKTTGRSRTTAEMYELGYEKSGITRKHKFVMHLRKPTSASKETP